MFGTSTMGSPMMGAPMMGAPMTGSISAQMPMMQEQAPRPPPRPPPPARMAIEDQFAAKNQRHARMCFDDECLAHVDINEVATQDSLENVIDILHSWSSRDKGKFIKGIVLHIEGAPAPDRLHSYAMATGNFLVGLRTLGLPITTCCWGTIAGPSWGLVLVGDYRIAAADTKFVLPILRPVECLQQLLGPRNATHLTMDSGKTSAGALLEMGVLHQVQKDKENAQKSGCEMATRIAQFPSLACRQTLTLMCPDAEEYVLAV